MKAKNTFKIDRQNLNHTNRKEIRELLKNTLDEKVRVKTWIKTLLHTYRLFPRIINAIDKIILTRASGYSFSTDIYNSLNRPENQFNVLIDMTERKKKLLNIYVMTKNLLDSLSKPSYDLIYSKFYETQTNEELANEYGVSTRTIFRRINDIIDKLYVFTQKNNWSLRFIEFQVKEEAWLIERYNNYLDELIVDTVK